MIATYSFQKLVIIEASCFIDYPVGLQVAASFSSAGAIMSELKQWNELYGEGGSRKKEQLTYFL